jgi:hypothetical protein
MGCVGFLASPLGYISPHDIRTNQGWIWFQGVSFRRSQNFRSFW